VIRLLLLLALIFSASGALAQELAPQRIAAVVNDQVVTMQDLDQRLRLIMATSGIQSSEQARARLVPQVLRGLIEETLQLQEADRLGIEVEPGEVDRALQNIAERNNLTLAQLQGFLRQNGIPFDTLVRQIRAQIAWVKVVNRQIRPRVQVTVDQLEMAVEEARQNQGQPEFLLSEIVLPVDNPAQDEAVRQDAQRLVQTVREGASFSALARQVSVAASAEQGGDVGWVPASNVPPELLPTLDELAPGEISDPIRSSVGYHVFELRDRRLGHPPIDDQSARVEVELAQIVFPTGGGSGPEVDARRSEAAELRDGLESCADVVALAEELDAPASGDLGWLKIGDLPPGLGDAVLALPVGEISPPLEGPAGIHLIMVCDRRDPPGLVPEREQISERLQNERIDRLARRYLRDLRKQAFVEVRI
jgi:peptidyl-prolyl cis-trans isomerase SurA